MVAPQLGECTAARLLQTDDDSQPVYVGGRASALLPEEIRRANTPVSSSGDQRGPKAGLRPKGMTAERQDAELAMIVPC